MRSPDGREWSVYASHVRLPAWHHSRYDPWLENDGIVGFVVLGPFFWLVVPLAWLVVQLPLAVLRPLFSGTRWVEAVSAWPNELKLIWKTRRGEAESVAEHVARRLPHGYEDLTAPGAELVYMSRPVGVDDLDA